MESMYFCLFLLILLVLSGIVTRVLKSIPAPFVQMILGAIAGIVAPGFYIDLNPELFMLLFIPPLLFNDSWHFPKREFVANSRPIIMLAIGLVFFTVVGIGYLLHWFTSTIPLTACFAMAAALAPTDAVSLKSLTAKTKLPTRITHILQGESLLNDASGLVAFKFSVIALITGTFSFLNAGVSLLVIGLGGILIGCLLTFLFIMGLGLITRKHIDETTTENLFLILLPYAAYLTAEHLGCSGIIAAVAAGFTVDKAGFLDKTMITMRIEGYFVWGMMETILNGIVFILLGLYLPHFLQLVTQTGFSISLYCEIVLSITISLVLLRIIWVYMTLPFEVLIAHHKKTKWRMPNLQLVIAIAFGGIRGTIALAAILSLPVILPDGTQFPGRTLLITLVVGIVFCSLLLSAVMLPIITPHLKNLLVELPTQEEDMARIAAAQAAIRGVDLRMEKLFSTLNEKDKLLCTKVGNGLTSTMYYFINSGIGEEQEKLTGRKALHFEKVLRAAAFDAAREELRHLIKKGQINNATMITVMHSLDIRQLSLSEISKLTPSPSSS